MTASIFEKFERTEVESDGESVYDFLGGAIRAEYKHGWENSVQPVGKRFKPPYPSLTEWTVDWIAALTVARVAGNSFSVVELGAGYGQWMVTSMMAYKTLNPQGIARGLAVEADAVHYDWLNAHVAQNLSRLEHVETHLIRGAAGHDGVVEFPVVSDPSKNYGASYSLPELGDGVVEVDSYSLASIYEQFSSDTVDLLHVDIQGAEADLIVQEGVEAQLKNTGAILFGTHRTEQLHAEVRQLLQDNHFDILVDWPRNSSLVTGLGSVTTYDGAIFAVARDRADQVRAEFDFSLMTPS